MEQFNFDDDQSDYNLLDEDPGVEVLGFTNGFSAMNDPKTYEPEDEKAELEKLVAAEREELNELMSACEEVDQKIESSHTVINKLQQEFMAMDALLQMFTVALDNSEQIMDNARSDNEVIISAAKDIGSFVSSHGDQLNGLIARTKEAQERTLNEAREVTALKKMTESRHIADMKELDDEIKSMRPIICDKEKAINEERNRLTALEEELGKVMAELKEAESSLAEANQIFQSLQEQVADLEPRDSEETETLANEIKIMEDKRSGVQAHLEAFSKGETQEWKFLTSVKQKIETYREEDVALKRKIVAHQKESEKSLEARMTELKQLSKDLSDAMDCLNLGRQKSYADRMDYDYMLSKNEMDFEKLAASGDEQLKELNAVLTDIRRQVDELRDLKRQLIELREKAADKDEAHSRKTNSVKGN